MAKKSSLTSSQKEALVEFMEDHPNLKKGKFSINFTTKVAKKLWEECGQLLNSIPGPSKEWHEWRKTWQDLKAKTKKKQIGVRQDISATGGGPPLTSQLDAVDERIINTIGEVPISGDPFIKESNVMFDFQQQPSNSGRENVELVNIPTTSDLMPLNVLSPMKPSPPKLADCQPTVETLTNLPQTKRSLKQSKTQRFQKTADATKTLSEVSSKRNIIVEEYYKCKIELLKKTVDLKERSVIAKEKIASALAIMAGLNESADYSFSTHE